MPWQVFCGTAAGAEGIFSFYTTMKSIRDVRRPGGNRSDSDDLRRSTKLAPAKKGGRERYSVYDGDDEEEMSLSLSKKESVFDYFDDGEESVG